MVETEKPNKNSERMSMKKALVSLTLAATLMLTACAMPEESSSPLPTMTESVAPEESSTPTALPTKSSAPIISELSLTTGLPSGKEYKPIAVMIENSAAARPQTGLQQADIVYECMVEGGITRFLCIFNDNHPVVVGPVRSVRLYFVNIQREWDAPLVHFGGPGTDTGDTSVYGSEFDDIKVRIDGIKGSGDKYFWRDSSRKAPHNAYTDLNKVNQEKYNYSPSDRVHFKFDANVTYPGEKVGTVSLTFSSSNQTHTQFKYDAATGLFTRYNSGKVFDMITVTQGADGKKETSTAPMTVKNLIVQYANYKSAENDGKGRRLVDMTGSGKCDFFVDGVKVSGKWERPKLSDSTTYTLEDGSPLVLKPGNTWIAVHPNSQTAVVS